MRLGGVSRAGLGCPGAGGLPSRGPPAGPGGILVEYRPRISSPLLTVTLAVTEEALASNPGLQGPQDA